MRIFLYKNFANWLKKEQLSFEVIRNCVDELEKGLFEASLGSGLHKKRIARIGQGKQGSYRTILAFRSKDRTFFLYAYAKNKRANISSEEKQTYRKLASLFLNADEKVINELLKTKKLTEV